MRKTIIRTLSAALLAGALAVGAGAAPTSASPSDIMIVNNTLYNGQWQVDGCTYRVQHGSFSGVPYTLMRIYNPASCAAPSVKIEYVAATGPTSVTNDFSTYTTASDCFGSYRQAIAIAPGAGIRVRGVATVSAGNSRSYATDGTVWQEFIGPGCG